MTVDKSLIREWLNKKMDADTIRTSLLSTGYDESTVEAYLTEFRKLRYAKRQMNGFILMTTGAVIGFLSCILTIINPIPSLHDFFLYGLTSLSIVVLCAGLYLVFE